MVTDQVIGFTLVGGTTCLVIYYTLWVIALPFVDRDQEFIHSWFPSSQYALGLPLLAGIVGLIMIGGFVAVVLVKSKMKQQSHLD